MMTLSSATTTRGSGPRTSTVIPASMRSERTTTMATGSGAGERTMVRISSSSIDVIKTRVAFEQLHWHALAGQQVRQHHPAGAAADDAAGGPINRANVLGHERLSVERVGENRKHPGAIPLVSLIPLVPFIPLIGERYRHPDLPVIRAMLRVLETRSELIRSARSRPTLSRRPLSVKYGVRSVSVVYVWLDDHWFLSLRRTLTA